MEDNHIILKQSLKLVLGRIFDEAAENSNDIIKSALDEAKVKVCVNSKFVPSRNIMFCNFSDDIQQDNGTTMRPVTTSNPQLSKPNFQNAMTLASATSQNIMAAAAFQNGGSATDLFPGPFDPNANISRLVRGLFRKQAKDTPTKIFISGLQGYHVFMSSLKKNNIANTTGLRHSTWVSALWKALPENEKALYEKTAETLRENAKNENEKQQTRTEGETDAEIIHENSNIEEGTPNDSDADVTPGNCSNNGDNDENRSTESVEEMIQGNSHQEEGNNENATTEKEGEICQDSSNNESDNEERASSIGSGAEIIQENLNNNKENGGIGETQEIKCEETSPRTLWKQRLTATYNYLYSSDSSSSEGIGKKRSWISDSWRNSSQDERNSHNTRAATTKRKLNN